MRLLKTIEKIIQESEEQYLRGIERGLPLDEVDRLEENYQKSLKLMDMLETKTKSYKSKK
jgi:replication-associated recombination protein RarA